MTKKRRDEVGIARALRRLDAIATEHPELRGATGANNVNEWIETLEDDEKGTEQMGKETTVSVAFRLPESILGRVDRHVERLRHDNPGIEFTRADAVRTLLTRALDEVESGVKRRKG
jgi:hypothetical protein